MAFALKPRLARILWTLLNPLTTPLQNLSDRLLQAEWDRHKASSRNPLQKAGAKYFSQADEDGITLEIIRRLKIENGCFFEFGVGDGRENNSLVLLARGWRGVWCGGEDLCINASDQSPHFVFLKRWIDANNIVDILHEGMARIGRRLPDVISLDLDGNDLEFARKLLAHSIKPPLFIAEYNGRFPPGVEWEQAYDRAHQWRHDDYMGASLQSFVNLFEKNDYQLVACNLITGANAFFVRNDLISPAFDDVPKGINANFVPLRKDLFYSYGHPISPRTIERIIELNETR